MAKGESALSPGRIVERVVTGWVLLMVVVFVAPRYSPAALQMIEGCLALPETRVGLIAQQSLEDLPAPLRPRLAAHWRVDDVTNPSQLEWGVRGLAAQLGTPDRLFGALEQAQLPLALVRERLGISGLPSEAARNFRDKARMKDCLRAAGIPVARHRLVSTLDDLRDFASTVGFPVVVKPPAGAGAQATERLRTDDDLVRAIARFAPAAHDPLLAEEFLQGTEHSMESVTIDGETIWQSITRYDPTPLAVLEQPWVQWTVLLPREIADPAFDDIRAIGASALRALGMTTGLSHAEWFRRADGSVAISEIAARPPGANMTTMLSRAHDVDVVAAWVRLMVHGTFALPERRYAVGTAYLRGQGQGRVRAIEGLEAIGRAYGSLICDVRLPHEGQAPTGSYEGEGFIIVRHPDTEVVRRALTDIISTVRVRLG